jgi:hypothetical protein
VSRGGLAFTRGAAAALIVLILPLAAHPQTPARKGAKATGTVDALAAQRRQATEELERLTAKLSAANAKRLQGVYVAFDTKATDPIALAACDDDGDYAVVMSDALLRMMSCVAQAKATDEVFGTHKLEDYAAWLVLDQTRRAPLIAPPSNWWDEAEARNAAKVELEHARMREALSGVVAQELMHFIFGDIVCPNPTSAREVGDAEWTREERDHALSVASKVYTPSRVLAADGTGTLLSLEAGRTEEGASALLSAFDRVEHGERAPANTDTADPPRPADAGPIRSPSSYLRLHPDSDVRAEVVRAAANQWRRLQAGGAHERAARP